MTTCPDLTCHNEAEHEGGGRGCVHWSGTGSEVDDRHTDGGHG